MVYSGTQAFTGGALGGYLVTTNTLGANSGSKFLVDSTQFK